MFKDNANKAFNSEENMMAFLNEREETVEWKKVEVNEIVYAGIETEALFFSRVSQFLDVDLEIAEDTLSAYGSKMFARCGGKTYAIRSSAMGSIMDRAKVYGKALEKISKDKLSATLNACSMVAGGKALIRISDGKISAVLGGDESDYSIIPAIDVVNSTRLFLQENYPEAKFKSGYWDHNYVRAEWSLADYAEKFAKSVEDIGSKVVPTLIVTTSDTGFMSATLHPRLQIDGRNVPLNSELKTEHKHRKTIADFEESLNMVYSHFLKSIETLQNLKKIEIEHGKTCMLRVMKKCAIPKKAGLYAAELFEAMYDDEPVTALDIYLCICDTLSYDDTSDTRRRFKLEDNISRCIGVNWKSYDLPGSFNW